MPFQTASNKQIAIKRQSGIGVPASGAGAAFYNVLPSSPLKLSKGNIENTVIRRDGQSARNRHGSRSGAVAYKLPLSQGTLDPLLEAALRGTFTAPIVITQATTLNGSAAAGNMTTTTTTIVATTGSFITQGVRKGQKIALTGAHAAANNGPWFRVVAVSALVVTVAGAAPLVLDAVASVAWTLTIAKQLLNPQTLIERYHTVEEYGQDMDLSLLGTDMKISRIDFNAQPDALIEIMVSFMGLNVVGQTTGTSPVLTTPTYATTIPLVMSDGTIRVGGVDYSVMTGLQWSWDMAGEIPKVIGSQTGPDVFLGPGKLAGGFSAIRSDLTFFNAFSAETPVDFFIDCVEPDLVDPKDFTSFYFGNITLSDNTPGQIGKTGADTEQNSWTAGIDDGGGDRALTTMIISSSAP